MNKIAIFGPPRSGTSWLAHIFNSHPDVTLRFQPLFSYEHKAALSPNSSYDDIDNFFLDIEKTNDLYTLMRSESQKIYPIFTKSQAPTHLVFKETRYLNVIGNILERGADVRVIGIIRNPLATLASWVRAPKEFSSNWDLGEEWRFACKKNQAREEEFFGFEKWKLAARTFLLFEREYPKRFKLIKYNDLNEATLKHVTEMFCFSELEMSAQTLKFLGDSKSRHDEDPYSVYRSKASDEKWRDVLPAYIVEKVLSEIENSELDIFLS